ncbi:MAG: CshA/CshB family fibrillar adhesin-related protein, partial [Comamonas sp.]
MLALPLLWLPQLANAAAYATGGTGKYKSEILWLTWGSSTNPLGLNGQPLSNGAVSKASVQVVNGVNIEVQCKLQNISGGLESYASGGYHGDVFDDAYNIGGPESANKLVAGLMTRNQTTNFQISCTSEFVGGSTRTPTSLRGFAISDAEAMASNGSEYIVGAAKGDWSVIERMGTNNDPYYVQKSSSQLGTPPIGNAGDSYVKFNAEVSESYRSVVTFLTFPPSSTVAEQTMSFQIKGGGNTAIAVGVLTPFADFGDAPTSYGAAMHLIDDVNLSGDGIAQNTRSAVIAANVAVIQSPRTLYLGSTGPDSEPSSPFSADGLGDDKSGQSASNPNFANEENGWPSNEKISVLKAGSSYSANIACNVGAFGPTSALVTGWIDFNQNGVFDSPAEKASGSCTGSQAQLSWNVPLDVKSGKTFVRLRIGSNASDMSTAESVARDGEVEDHAIVILAPALAVAKTSNASSGGWTVDQAGAFYTLTVSNRGSIPTGPGPAPYWKPLKVLDLMPDGVLPAWSGVLTAASGWSCSYSGQLVTCENASTHLGESGSATSQSSIELPVKITSKAVTGSSVTNYASVGGGMDPNNGGEPPAPGACSTPSYCASTAVTVKQPAISVSKMALPADQSKVKVDDIISYTLQVVVKDSATLSAVVLTDTLGAGLEYVGIASNTGGFLEGGSANTRTFTLAAGAVPGNYSVIYRAKVLANAVSKVGNKVVPAGGGNPSDPNPPVPACVTCSTEHSLESPLVTVSKSSDPASGQTVKSGQTITFTLTTVVSRSQTVSPVVLSDALGADLLFGVIVANDGFVPSGSGNQRVFTLPAGKLPGTYVLRYTAQVKANASASSNLSNVVTATGGGNPSDPGPACTV